MATGLCKPVGVVEPAELIKFTLYLSLIGMKSFGHMVQFKVVVHKLLFGASFGWGGGEAYLCTACRKAEQNY
jgi:energy-converting hydrogenase Eha subunit H